MSKKVQILLICAAVTTLLAIASAYVLVRVQKAWQRVEEPLSMSIDHTTEIGLTPNQIRSIEQIGQFETLCIQDEEMVDTVHRRLLLSDEKLVRIYHGTLRLGVDLKQAQPDWATSHGDTAVLVLPPVQLLDDKFIDEARTRSFYESGSWDATTRKILYLRAQKAMKRRCLTAANLQQAQQNAQTCFTRIFQSLGYNVVEITFAEP